MTRKKKDINQDCPEQSGRELPQAEPTLLGGQSESITPREVPAQRPSFFKRFNRIFVGVAVCGVLFGSVAVRQFNPIIFDMIVLLLMLLCGIEMAHAVGNRYTKPLLGFVIAYPFLSVGAYIGGIYLTGFGSFMSGLAGVFFMLIPYLFILWIATKTSKRCDPKAFQSTVFCILYPMTLGAFMLGLNRLGSPRDIMDFDTAYHATPIALLFMISAFSDMFAMLFGVTFKGPKLCPKISPKKTISGAIGGLLGGIIGAGLTVFFATQAGWQSAFDMMPLPGTLSGSGSIFLYTFLFGILGSLATQSGDLLASFIKRKVGIKDYGKMLGSHGGIMDRVDGQLANGVVLYITLMIVRSIAGSVV